MSEAIVFCNHCGLSNTAGALLCAHCGGIFEAVTQPVVSTTSVRYGGFWIRLVAALIDGIIVQAVVFPVTMILGAMIGAAGIAVSMPGEGIRLVGFIVGAALGFLASWIYEATLESSSRQATLGKMALRLKVTGLAGNRISFARATGRHFGKYLSTIILCIGYILAGITERKQALHDMIAGTLVQRT